MNYKRSLIASDIKKYDSAYNKVCKCIKNYDCNIIKMSLNCFSLTSTQLCIENA